MRVVPDPSFNAQLNTLLGRNIDDAGKLLEEAIVAAISTQGPPPSSPGDPPHIDSGDLIKSISREPDPDHPACRVGANVPYAQDLELGTDKVQARPFMIPTLMANADAIAREIAKP